MYGWSDNARTVQWVRVNILISNGDRKAIDLPVGVEGADVPGFKFDVVTKDCGLSRRLYVA